MAIWIWRYARQAHDGASSILPGAGTRFGAIEREIPMAPDRQIALLLDDVLGGALTRREALRRAAAIGMNLPARVALAARARTAQVSHPSLRIARKLPCADSGS